MKIFLDIATGETLDVGFYNSKEADFHPEDGTITISTANDSIMVSADMPDTSGREGILYREDFNRTDIRLAVEKLLLQWGTCESLTNTSQILISLDEVRDDINDTFSVVLPNIDIITYIELERLIIASNPEEYEGPAPHVVDLPDEEDEEDEEDEDESDMDDDGRIESNDEFEDEEDDIAGVVTGVIAESLPDIKPVPTKEEVKATMADIMKNVKNKDVKLSLAKAVLHYGVTLRNVIRMNEIPGEVVRALKQHNKDALTTHVHGPASDDQLFDKVKFLLIDHLGSDYSKVKHTTKLQDDLGTDSLDAVEIIMAIEEEFGVEIPDDVTDTIVTVDDIVRYLRANAVAD